MSDSHNKYSFLTAFLRKKPLVLTALIISFGFGYYMLESKKIDLEYFKIESTQTEANIFGAFDEPEDIWIEENPPFPNHQDSKVQDEERRREIEGNFEMMRIRKNEIENDLKQMKRDPELFDEQRTRELEEKLRDFEEQKVLVIEELKELDSR